MNPWIGKGLVLAGMVLLVAIRAPFARRSEAVPVAKSYRGTLEIALVLLVLLGYAIFPLLSMATPWLSSADYPFYPVNLLIGVLSEALGLWLFYRSHADLGNQWSVTLELKTTHQLVTAGVYSRVRHPMYTALFLTAIAQALLLPNWIAGPSYFVAFSVMVLFRIGPEERMMREQFGQDYADYAARTNRLVPGLF